MCKVFLFVGDFYPFTQAYSSFNETGLFVGLAITEKGKWVAGACSQTEENAFVYLERMKPKIAERVGRASDEVELVREFNVEAVKKALLNMP